MITKDYLLQRRAELVQQQQRAQVQAEQARAAALQLSGAISQVDELLAMLAPTTPAES